MNYFIGLFDAFPLSQCWFLMNLFSYASCFFRFALNSVSKLRWYFKHCSNDKTSNLSILNEWNKKTESFIMNYKRFLISEWLNHAAMNNECLSQIKNDEKFIKKKKKHNNGPYTWWIVRSVTEWENFEKCVKIKWEKVRQEGVNVNFSCICRVFASVSVCWWMCWASAHMYWFQRVQSESFLALAKSENSSRKNLTFTHFGIVI